MLKHLAAIALILVVACAPKAPPNISPEGKIALYGDRFLEAVELAQKQVIMLADNKIIPREDAVPAVEIFVQIGRGGQTLAKALRVIDESNVTEDQRTAAEQARIALDVFNALITDVLKDVKGDVARDRIAEIIKGVQLAKRFMDLWQVLSPWLPPITIGAERVSYVCESDGEIAIGVIDGRAVHLESFEPDGTLTLCGYVHPVTQAKGKGHDAVYRLSA